MKKIIAMVLLVTLLFSGCTVNYVTEKLWKDHYDAVPYNETVDALMINPENNSMVFIGEKYHYIFDPNEKFSYLLQHHDNSMIFDVESGKYEVQEENVSAFLHVSVDKKTAKKEVLEWIHNNGYDKYDKPNHNKMLMVIYIKGKRYIADPSVNKIAQKLSKQYHLQVTEKQLNNMNNATRIALTPLTATVDGIQIVGSATSIIVATGLIAAIGTPLLLIHEIRK